MGCCLDLDSPLWLLRKSLWHCFRSQIRWTNLMGMFMRESPNSHCTTACKVTLYFFLQSSSEVATQRRLIPAAKNSNSVMQCGGVAHIWLSMLGMKPGGGWTVSCRCLSITSIVELKCTNSCWWSPNMFLWLMTALWRLVPFLQSDIFIFYVSIGLTELWSETGNGQTIG